MVVLPTGFGRFALSQPDFVCRRRFRFGSVELRWPSDYVFKFSDDSRAAELFLFRVGGVDWVSVCCVFCSLLLRDSSEPLLSDLDVSDDCRELFDVSVAFEADVWFSVDVAWLVCRVLLVCVGVGRPLPCRRPQRLGKLGFSALGSIAFWTALAEITTSAEN